MASPNGRPPPIRHQPERRRGGPRHQGSRSFANCRAPEEGRKGPPSSVFASSFRDEAQDVSRSGNNDEYDQTQTLSSENERGVSGNSDAGYQPLTSEDESRGVSGNNDPGYQPLTNEEESAVMSGDNAGYQPLTIDHENNDDDHQPLLTNEDEPCDAPVPDKADCKSPANNDEVYEFSSLVTRRWEFLKARYLSSTRREKCLLTVLLM